jgi:hypothetical protein
MYIKDRLSAKATRVCGLISVLLKTGAISLSVCIDWASGDVNQGTAEHRWIGAPHECSKTQIGGL